MRGVEIADRPRRRAGRPRRLHLLRRVEEARRRRGGRREAEGLRGRGGQDRRADGEVGGRRPDDAHEDGRRTGRSSSRWPAKADEAEVSGITTQPRDARERARSSTRTPADLAQFGLAEPRIDVGFKTGGDKDVAAPADRRQDADRRRPLREAARARRRCSSSPAFLETTFNRSTFDLRDKTVLAFERDKVDRVEVERAAATVAASLAKAASGALEKPIQARADYGTVEGLVGRLQTAQMKSIAAQEAADLKPYGLDKPERRPPSSAWAARGPRC